MGKSNWKTIIRPYQNGEWPRSLWQLTNTLVPYMALWCVMYHTLHFSFTLTVVLSILSAGFLVRIFIIFHDCTHGSFFPSAKWNEVVGFLTGVLLFTPFHAWRYKHVRHHATAGDLDNRGTGDVWTLTVREYEEASLGTRLVYRLSRNPIVLFIIGPIYLFLIHQRFPFGLPKKRDRLSVHLTNLCLFGLIALLCWVMGFKNFMIIQLLTLAFAASAGVWIFYVQHQFEGMYWERNDKWDYVKQAMQGSSFYRLPKILQWFTGNIGYHHIHHLSPRIPNYKLEQCHTENPMFQDVRPITFWSSFKSLAFRLWDEDRQELVGYKKK